MYCALPMYAELWGVRELCCIVTSDCFCKPELLAFNRHETATLFIKCVSILNLYLMRRIYQRQDNMLCPCILSVKLKLDSGKLL